MEASLDHRDQGETKAPYSPVQRPRKFSTARGVTSGNSSMMTRPPWELKLVSQTNVEGIQWLPRPFLCHEPFWLWGSCMILYHFLLYLGERVYNATSNIQLRNKDFCGRWPRRVPCQFGCQWKCPGTHAGSSLQARKKCTGKAMWSTFEVWP